MNITLDVATKLVRENNTQLRETSLKLIETKLRILFENTLTLLHGILNGDKASLFGLIEELSSVYKINTVKSYLQAVLYLAKALDLALVPDILMEVEKLKSAFEKEGGETKVVVDQEWDENRLIDFLRWAETASVGSTKSYRDYVILLLHSEVPLRQESKSLYFADNIFEFESLFMSGKNVVCLCNEADESFLQLHMSKTSSKHNYPRVPISQTLYYALRRYVDMAGIQSGEQLFGSGEHSIRSTGSRLYELCQRRYQTNPRGGVCNWIRRIHARRAHENKRSVEVANQLGHSFATHAKVYLASTVHNQIHNNGTT